MGHGAGLGRFYPNLTYQCSPQVETLVAAQAPSARIVDLGAGGRKVRADAITVDFVDFGNTSIISDVCATPLEDGAADLLVATGILEHVEREDLFMAEIARLVRPGGQVLIEVPFLQQFHGDPIDMRRYTVDGLKELVTRYGFEVETAGFHIGPSVTIATLNAYYASLLFQGKGQLSKVLSNAAYIAVGALMWPLKFLDKWVKDRPGAYRLAFGVYVVARRG